MNDDEAIALALSEAEAAARRGEVPVGAVLLSGGAVLAADGNRVAERRDPTAHAEQLVLRAGAATLGNERLNGTTLYVTLEPCAMCAGALVNARVARLVFGTSDPKAGAVVSLYQIGSDARLNHRFEVEAGLMAEEGARRLSEFFAALRRKRP